MNIQTSGVRTGPPAFPMSIDAFFDWLQHQDERYELVDGVPHMMPFVTRGHSLIASNVMHALATRLDRRAFIVHGGEFAVKTGERSIRFADIMVEPMSQDLDELLTDTAVLLVEVLSDSTQSSDLGPKRTEYQRLPNLASYLVLDQERRRAWVWTRLRSGTWPTDPEIIETGNVAVPGLALEMPIDEIYANVPGI